MYFFTKYWFDESELKKYIDIYLDEYSKLSILEIGIFEGNSTMFFGDKYLNHVDSFLDCVDPYLTKKDNDHNHLLNNMTEVYFKNNLNLCKNKEKINFFKMSSNEFFEKNNKTYDFIYIDGCHDPEQVGMDLTNSFKSLNDDGIIWIDDYLGNDLKIKPVVDEIVSASRFKIIHSGYQLAIRL